MIKLIKETKETQPPKTKPMCSMQPLEVCVVDEVGSRYDNHVVMRTAILTYFEVMDLTNPGEGSCWTTSCTLAVRELYPGETFTLELS